MDDAATGYVQIEQLLQRSGDYIADLLGVEAAYPTPGCFAAMSLSAAACITRGDPGKLALLPHTEGMKNQIVMQKKQQYGYGRAYSVAGGVMVFAGDENGCTAEQLEDAIGPDTAAVTFLIREEDDPDIVGHEETVEIAHSKGVLAIADGAAQIYPIDRFCRNAQSADLVCFGGKYMGAPHATGLMCGKKELVDAAPGFIPLVAGETTWGRGMKMDRQSVVALVSAVEHWMTMDHEDRLIGYESRLSAIKRELDGVPYVSSEVEHNNRYFGVTLNVSLDTEALGKDANQVVEELESGDPSIMAGAPDDGVIAINSHELYEGEEFIVAERLKSLLSG